jgi:hypothetical protein
VVVKRTDEPSGRRTRFSRRGVVKATAGALALSLGSAAAAGRSLGGSAQRPVDPSSPRDVAEAYVATLDAGARAAANELIAEDGELDPWSEGEFRWVESFEFEFTGFRVVEETDRTVLGAIELTLGGTAGTVRYRFRRTDAGDWRIGAAVDGLRTGAEQPSGPAAVARSYVAALDADDRAAANELIAEDADLERWSERRFEWVGSFEFGFVDFRRLETAGDRVVGNVELEVDGQRGTVRYEFRETGGGWKLWRSIDGLRVQRGTAAAAAEAYVDALDAGNRAAANELIAEDGDLAPWSPRSLGWIEPFDVELVEFDPVRRAEGSVTADLTVRIADSTERLRYELRRVDAGGWKLWRGPTGLR